MKRKRLCLPAALMLLLTGCTQAATYQGFVKPDQPASTLKPISDTYQETVPVFSDEGTPDSCLAEFASGDGVCQIRQMEHYYDVTIDYAHHTPAEAGRAYAEAVLKVFPDFHSIVEPYIYENIVMAFPALRDDYSPVIERVTALAETIRPAQREELYSYAEAISGGEHGFAPDGKISYEEALTFNLVPEALRGTACSALTLWGSKTVTGDMLASRFLDWNLGSDYQMCKMHAVIHAENGSRSFTGISFLGFVSVISAVNDDGVFGAILDVGSERSEVQYSYANKKCYTYELRYALEEFDTARAVGEYMVENSRDFTYSHHIYLADGKETFCAEDAVGGLQNSGLGYSVLRDSETPLMESLQWDHPDSLCVVNSFAAKGNQESFSGGTGNIVRFNKYNEWLGGQEKFTVGAYKSAIAREKVRQGEKEGEAEVQNVRNPGTSQIILVDYHTGRIQVAFTPASGPSDDVIFTDVGKY
ncbi:MAG: hypothetical protein IK130_07370 [Oscillospiraceae bacterium]|nr:hypothetical protein [Oscillospiraceae bacterium]